MTDTLPRRGTETPATTPRAAAPAASASTVDVDALGRAPEALVPLDARRDHRVRARPVRVVARDRRELRVGCLRALLLRAARAAGRRPDPAVHRALGGHRIPARHTHRPRPAVEVAAAEQRRVAVRVVLPLGAPRRAAGRLVQPRLPVPDARARHPVHHRLLARRVSDHAADLGVRRRRARAEPAPGRLLGRDHPRRTAVGRPGSARGGRLARHPARRGRCTTRSGCSPPPECVLRPGLRRPSFRDSDPARARRSGCPRAARAPRRRSSRRRHPRHPSPAVARDRSAPRGRPIRPAVPAPPRRGCIRRARARRRRAGGAATTPAMRRRRRCRRRRR